MKRKAKHGRATGETLHDKQQRYVRRFRSHPTKVVRLRPAKKQQERKSKAKKKTTRTVATGYVNPFWVRVGPGKATSDQRLAARHGISAYGENVE